MTLVTDSPILSPENLTGLYYPLSEGPSFILVSPISENEGDASLTIKSPIHTVPTSLKLNDPVTKLT